MSDKEKVIKAVSSCFDDWIDRHQYSVGELELEKVRILKEDAIAMLRRSKRMNAKQAAREAAKRIEDLEVTLSRAMSDIKRYNQCIDSMIEGGSPCDWCEDRRECHLEAQGKGCGLWMLSYEEEENNGDHDIVAGVVGRTGGGMLGVGTGGAEVSESPDGIQPDAGDGG